MTSGKIFSINCSKTKGVPKTPVGRVLLVKGAGLDKDAHAGPGLRQVSLLSVESIRRQAEQAKLKGKDFKPEAGNYAENITTEGIDLSAVKPGDRFRVGREAVLEISKIGKECHRHCAIYHKIGDCIMPREGIFAEVLEGGEIVPGDSIEELHQGGAR